MDQIYPLAGTTTSSCASQDFEFLNYWVDQTVEKEILRGKKLRELKTRPIVRKKYDVVNIGHTENKCRSRSQKKSRKKERRNSPKRKRSPIREFTKRDSKSSRQRCPMRIAELSVPSKRQCIDTWRTKYHVLPGIMIDRLRHHVMDLSPVVKIPDAIECFKIHKNAEKKKKKEAQEKKREIKKCDCNDNVKKKPSKVQECGYLCAIFGHKIAKELNKPMQVTFNTELQKISNVISIEIEKLINKDKRIDGKNIKNKRVHAEVAGKITIWITNILEETAYKILEDQLKDLEEEVGPVLDVIDEMVDNVVNVCEPEPEVIEYSPSSDTFNVESSTDYKGKEEESTADNISVDIDFPPEAEPIIENLDDFIKNELDNIINSFDGDMPADIEEQPVQDSTELEKIADKEQNEFVDANDTFEVNLNESEPQVDSAVLQDSSQSKEGTLITDGEKDADPDNYIINDLLSEDDSNKKVKFSDLNMVTIDGTTEESAPIFYDEYLNPDQAAPKDYLSSNMDEPWPENIVLPIVRPSESVSKSITSLGKIMEAEERMSVLLDDDTNTKAKGIVINNILDAQVNETNEGITNANKNIIQVDDNAGVLNDTAAKINETRNIAKDDRPHNNRPQDTNEIINSYLSDSMQLNEILYDATTQDTKDLSTNEIETNKNIDPKTQEIEQDGAEQPDTFIGKDGTTNTQDSQKDGIERTDEYIDQDGATYTKALESKDDITKRIDEHTGKDGIEYAEGQEIEYFGTDGTDKYIGIDGKLYTKEPGFDYDETDETDGTEYIGNNGKIYTKGQENKEREIKTDFIGKDGQMINRDLNNLATYVSIHHPSMDSTFDHDVPTKTIAYEQKLYKILEEQGTQVTPISHNKLEDEATQVKDAKILEDEATKITPMTYKKVDVETADKEINTSFALVPRADRSTSVASQSLGDIAKRLQGVKADNMFSSLRIKPKVDYKVHKKSAPTWVTQNFGEPTDSFYSTPPKQQEETNDKNIRLWCKDLQNGFENLELWNGWIENTLENVKITEIKKARICIDKSKEEFVRDWLQLKKNVDADVITWTKLSKSTQVKLKGFRKIYQNFETPPPQPAKFCNCHT